MSGQKNRGSDTNIITTPFGEEIIIIGESL
jgi:hypothetical protein